MNLLPVHFQVVHAMLVPFQPALDALEEDYFRQTHTGARQIESDFNCLESLEDERWRVRLWGPSEAEVRAPNENNIRLLPADMSSRDMTTCLLEILGIGL